MKSKSTYIRPPPTLYRIHIHSNQKTVKDHYAVFFLKTHSNRNSKPVEKKLALQDTHYEIK